MNQLLLGALLGFGVPAILGIGIALFAKLCPKEQTFKTKIAPFAENLADASYILMSTTFKLKPVDIDKIEEGFFKTIAYWLDGFIAVFMARLDIKITEEINKK
jgi:hypothetical protein